MSKERGQWGSRAGFILAAIGSAVGVGNLWRFPYIAASNGGGAFLIPYLFALLTAGIPILILEFSIAHKLKTSAALLFGKVNKKFRALGWFQTLISFVIMAYYSVIVAWIINYIVFAATSAWGTDTKGFFFSDFLQISAGPLQISGFNVMTVLALTLIWGLNLFVIRGGIKKGIEVANKIAMPLLVTSLVVIVVRGITLPGAAAGLDYFFKPDFAKLASPDVWIAAYSQIFFSLSIAFGIMITYASYLPEKTDLVNNAFMTGLGNCAFSIFAGVAVFSVLGYMAGQQGVEVAKVASQGIGLAFIVFPEAINSLPGFNGLFGIVFFLCLLFAGFSSSISITEVVVAGLNDKFNTTRKRAVSITIGAGFLASLLFATDAGLYLLDIVDHYINTYAITFAGLAEIIILGYFIDIEELRVYANSMSDFSIGKWWNYTLKILTPAMLVIMLVMNTIGDIVKPYEGYEFSALMIFGVGSLAFLVIGATIMSHIKTNDPSSDIETRKAV